MHRAKPKKKKKPENGTKNTRDGRQKVQIYIGKKFPSQRSSLLNPVRVKLTQLRPRLLQRRLEEGKERKGRLGGNFKNVSCLVYKGMKVS